MLKRVAIIDNIQGDADVSLYIERDNKELEDIEWPADWPQYVTTKFLEEHGYTERIWCNSNIYWCVL